MPVTAEVKYRDDITAVFNSVLDNHPSHSWPPQGLFVEHIPKSVAGIAAPVTFTPNREGVMARKMNDGEGVPEAAVWGHLSQRLMSSGDVSSEIMDRYRKGSIEAFVAAYRGDAATFAESKLGPIVRGYFKAAPAGMAQP